jgi:hypothetical protein
LPPGWAPIYSADRARCATVTKDLLQKLAEELLSNPRFAQVFMSAVQTGLEAKGQIDRNMRTLLGLLNLPSRADVNKLATKLEVLQGSLTNLNLKVDRLLAERAVPRRRRPPKPPGSATPE